MGLFDKIFKKKKPASSKARSTPTSSATTRTPPATSTGQYQKQLPRKGPPAGTTRRGVYSGQSRSRGLGTQPYRDVDKSKLDPQSRKILEESLAKIPRDIRVEGSAQAPGQTAGASGTGKVVMRQPVSSGTSTGTVKSTEDTMGEEELFKKLVQWDKELQTKKVAKKVRVSSHGQPGKPAEKTKVVTENDLSKRERELKRYAAKLREKEKKLKKMEDMNKVFSQLEDSELEQFSPPQGQVVGPGVVPLGGVGGVQNGGAAVAVPAAPVGLEEGGIGQPEIDSEDLLQPLKTLIFDNFIVGPSNRFAHDVALSVAKAPADAYNPLFIYSSVGLGKTHLLCAIGNYILGKKPDAEIVYISSEKFTNELLDYLRLGEMEKFRTKYRNIDVLLIDDIQFIGGQEGTQEEFFHTFNALYNAHKQIVITSDRPPKNIAHLKDRLRSRFEGGLIVNIKLPDLGTRTMILHEKAEKDGIYIPDEILNYIAAKVKSNVRTLIGVLNRIVAHSSLTDRDLDKSLVDEVLKDVVDEGIDISNV